ncbi:MAG: hypothetical protein COA66_00390 [Arcobacter sp.]|nr:MAG: hypothetical protein COA66_00390 [Arcobacter sp.]
MEFGLVAKLQEFQFNSSEKVQKVNELKAVQPLKEHNDVEEIYTNEISSLDKTKEVSKTENLSTKNYTEVVLSNLNFGFNDASKDFFVKVTRGTAENKYPTDEMMRLKAYLIHENKQNIS